MDITVDFNSLTSTTHPPNFNLPSSGQHVTARLSALKVSVAGAKRAEDPLVVDTNKNLVSGVGCGVVGHLRQ